jgi:DNA-binding LytR/AlgR family response regulator
MDPVTAADQSTHEEAIPVELAGVTTFIPRTDIRWVEAHGDYARLHTVDGSHLVRMPLAHMESNWADAGFIRIHRSYLVSLRVITEMRTAPGGNGYTVVVGDREKELPVSRRHTKNVKDHLIRRMSAT